MANEFNAYYIGFNANNAIENDCFFAGSITLYPTLEKGNYYYSDKLLSDVKSDSFLKDYHSYIYETIKKIQNIDENACFLCFNERIKELCKDMTDINFMTSVDDKVIKDLNNKFEVRNQIKSFVPILDYYWVNGCDLDYSDLKEKMQCDEFVVQSELGVGGDTTYLVQNEEQLNAIQDKKGIFCISKYVENVPLNVTLIVGDDDMLQLPISAQLISLTDRKFKYVGGDFIYPQQLDDEVLEKINLYSKIIGEFAKEKGYRGILGIDFILTRNSNVYFMEINPRFQSSSFLISMELKKIYNTDIAELHFQALSGKRLSNVILAGIDHSFLNCNEEREFKDFADFTVVKHGYFPPNVSSFYRKVFDYSIVSYPIFENISKSDCKKLYLEYK